MRHRKLTPKDHKVITTAVGKAFKKLRLNAGKSIIDISFAVDIPANLLEQLEKGEYDLNLTEYKDLCEYYNTTPSAFISNLEID